MTDPPPRSPAGSHPHRRTGSWRSTHTADQVRMPNDIPNTTGLRHDTAPHHGPQSTAATTPCTAPDATISVPHHHRNRCCAVIGRTASQTCRMISLMAGDATFAPYGERPPSEVTRRTPPGVGTGKGLSPSSPWSADRYGAAGV